MMTYFMRRSGLVADAPEGFYSCDILVRLITRESGPGARLGRFTPLDVAYVGLKSKLVPGQANTTREGSTWNSGMGGT